ncbi:insulinase family protein [Myxococcota bacterium]|jgi:zinc protease|nr:insulinase family protein [Myxococcota bacterium]
MIERTRSGARLLLDPMPDAPCCAVQLWVDAGAVNERPDEHGAAHFVEHMLFKGTPTRGVGAIAAEIEGAGGDINAWTTFESTAYYATLPAERFTLGLEVLTDMLRASLFEPEEIEREREVILDELRGVRDDPDQVLSEAVAAAAFQDHPYGRPIAGSERAVKALTRDSLLGFWRRWVRPDKLIISIAGAFDLGEARALVDRLVPPHAEGPSPSFEPLRAARPQRRRRTTLIEGRFEEPLVELAFRGLGCRAPGSAAADLLANALGEGFSSVLGAELQATRGLVTSTWGHHESEREDGLMSFGFAPRQGKLPEALDICVEALRRVARDGLPLEVAQRARGRMLAGLRGDEETAEGRAHANAWHLLAMNDPDGGARYRGMLERVSPDDLRRVARERLRPESLVVGALLPEGELDAAAFRERLDRAVRAPSPIVAPRPAIHREVLDNGVTLVVECVESSPATALRAVVLGGQLEERPAHSGLTELWARTVSADGMNLQELSELLDGRGAELDAFSGRSTQGARAEQTPELLDDGITLLASLLARPCFDEGDLNRARDELIEEERLLHDSPQEVAQRHGLRMLFGPHPYGLDLDGAETRLPRLGVGQLRALHKRVFYGGNLVVAATGALTPDRALRRLRRALSGLPGGAYMPRPRPQAQFPSTLQRSRIPSEREQAWLWLGWPGARLGEPDADALGLAAAALGGQGGRLFVELRDRRGLAYHVSADSQEGWDVGHFSVSMGTAPERAAEAITTLRDEVRRFAQEGPTPAELSRVKESALGGLAMGRQRAGSRALELALWERYGRDARTARATAERLIRSLDADAVRVALARRLAASPGVEVHVAGETP